ncbi:iron uptake cluster protein [Rhodofomes roseus]|uniref:Iron uptake cluster protein n=1 Tax=Rhodofomes roseus TaxID=34475 RepID=A0ABQ8KRD2_9APHY|nr:iron uptake cluster protein [Rhodofomes roseus]KAH9841100.1 iron uptake cluster protein [Rhodofomes roseus]
MVTALNKTVVVLGLSYGGAHAARTLSQKLPKGWRVVCIDRNTHFNHLYVLPRFAVVPGHEHKAFIPYQPMLTLRDPTSLAETVLLHAHITSLSPKSLTLSRAFPEHGIKEPERKLHFDYALYALGSHLPAPINLWGPVGNDPDVFAVTKGMAQDVVGKRQTPTAVVDAESSSYEGTKPEGISWLQRFGARIESAFSILVVGGGPLGVQYSTDIKERFPSKHVTLLHSRAQLLPTFVKGMHDEIMSTLTELDIPTILGDRLDLASVKEGRTVINPDGKRERVVRTVSGREVRAELILLCTGQVPNTGLMAQAVPEALISEGSKKGQTRVARTMQVAVPAMSDGTESIQAALSGLSLSDKRAQNEGDEPVHVPYPNLFAVGDAVDGYGANNAGRNSHYMADVAVKNILKLIEQSEQGGSGDVELEKYVPGPLSKAIKISLGMRKQLVQNDEGKAVTSMDGVEDLRAPSMWELYGVSTDDMHR